MKEEEIKPCPFCGGRDTWQLTKTEYCQLHGDPFQNNILGCFHSHCFVQPIITGVVKENLLKDWNKRINK